LNAAHTIGVNVRDPCRPMVTGNTGGDMRQLISHRFARRSIQRRMFCYSRGSKKRYSVLRAISKTTVKKVAK
jgi:hypothetical protein